MAWVIVWVGLGLALGLWVAATQGRSAATEYFAAYLLEESLSVDNIFVFVVIFSELHIPAEHQRRVLLFGVAGALVFRAWRSPPASPSSNAFNGSSICSQPSSCSPPGGCCSVVSVSEKSSQRRVTCAPPGSLEWCASVLCCTDMTSGDARAAGSSRHRYWWRLSSSKRPTSSLR
ncbi:MAG: hypothetical protein DMF87_05275, partial [Acidobacteria bacterium]